MSQLKQLRIDLVSDVMCPWCAIGYASLNKALTELSDQIHAEIHWQPFELNPNMPAEGQDLSEHLKEKYDSSPEQSAEIRQRISSMGEELGFKFNFSEGMKIYNTFNAHQLLHWAAQDSLAKQTELKMALLKAYFTDNLDVSQNEVLLTVVESIGLDRQQAEQHLTQQTFAQVVRQSQEQWRTMGISSVPSFIINQKHLLSGGQPAEVFSQALLQIANED